MIVYMILNEVSFKYYIGKTKEELQTYLDQNIRSALLGRNDKPHLYNSFRKYKKEVFCIFPLVSSVSDNEAKAYEQVLILLFNSRDPDIGYNITQGGDGYSEWTEESKQKARKSKLGKKHSKETIKKRVQSLREKVLLGWRWAPPNLKGRKVCRRKKRKYSRKQAANKFICYCCFKPFTPRVDIKTQVFCSMNCSAIIWNKIRSEHKTVLL